MTFTLSTAYLSLFNAQTTVLTMSPADRHNLQAAQGWLELGNHVEAAAELERIPASKRSHPEVLQLRWHIYAKTNNWVACVDIARATQQLAPSEPAGWIHHSYALHELKRTQEAFDNLLPVAVKFPNEATVFYNLAYYTCQLGHLDASRSWLEKAFNLDRSEERKLRAMDDPDLAPLWECGEAT